MHELATRRVARVVLATFTATLILGAAVRWSVAAPPYAPEQPIDFHHRDHVKTDRLDCEMCHSGARRSPFAGMPPVERCMGCHRFVQTIHPDVIKLRQYYDKGAAIPWVKVNSLPRFVHFNHEAHVLAHVSCDTCHGNVAEMDRVARVAPLTMGWCVTCHRASKAPDDCLTCHY